MENWAKSLNWSWTHTHISSFKGNKSSHVLFNTLFSSPTVRHRASQSVLRSYVYHQSPPHVCTQINSFQAVLQINGFRSFLGRNVGAKDGILFTWLYGMTFMLGCCPILSPGVARRQQRPRCKRILGNDGTNKYILQICNLSSAFVLTWVNGNTAREENQLF